MEARSFIGRIAAGICALLAGIFFLAGCETRNGTPEDGWVPIGRASTDAGPKEANAARASSTKAHHRISVLSARNPWGSYDRAFIGSVEHRWQNLVDSQSSTLTNKGIVVLEFSLHPNGSVSDMRIVRNTVATQAAAVCWRAILDPAPYRPWPADMQKTLGDKRSIRFTFYY